MADRDKALEDYKAGLSYKEIADKHNVSESTVKSWASRHWNNDKKIQAARRKAKKSQLKGKKSCNQKSEKKSQKDAPKPRGAPIGNKNAAGNNGGAPKGSKNALWQSQWKIQTPRIACTKKSFYIPSVSEGYSEQLIPLNL